MSHMWHPLAATLLVVFLLLLANTATSKKKYIARHHSHNAKSEAARHRDRAQALVTGGVTPLLHSPAYQHFTNLKAGDVSLKEDLRGMAYVLLAMNYTGNCEDYHEIEIDDDELCPANNGYYCKRKTIKYRTHNGTCNNLRKPGCGRANSGLLRMLPASFSDGVYRIRRSITGNHLPSARFLVNKVFSTKRISSPDFNLLFMQLGQFFSHDTALSSTKQSGNGTVTCCTQDGSDVRPLSEFSAECLPIVVPKRDPFYQQCGIRCMEFVRALTAPPEDCKLQPAIPMTIVTSHLDLSPVYGNTDEENKSLREGKGGRLNVSRIHGNDFMPLGPLDAQGCSHPTINDRVCFRAGDVRTNQNPLLSAFHVLFLRLHNRLTELLSKLNPHWHDEKIYQESRRLLIAAYQHIVYNEMVPIFIGSDAYEDYFQNYKYEENECIGTFVEFTSVAYRYFHTLASGLLEIITKQRELQFQLDLSQYFGRPTVVTQHFEGLILGAVTQPGRESDENMEIEIAGKLFRQANETCGLDLISIDIQRARDHGVPPYNDLREHCGLPRAKSFEDLSPHIPPEGISKLEQLYDHVDDIDPYIGGALETKVPGTLMGPTFLCLLIRQFWLTQRADRFFYENKQQHYSFTDAQLAEIKKASMARLICDFTGVEKIQAKALLQISDTNPLVSCESIPKLDFSHWKENH